MNEVTRVLTAIEQGDPKAAKELLPLVYEELRKLAEQRIAQERPGQTLQATALVHEAYLRLVGGEVASTWDSRAHFFGAAAEAMRRILVESARRRRRLKRGGGRERCDLDEAAVVVHDADGGRADALLALDAAMEKLARKDPLKAKLVQLRYFTGLTIDEAARVLGISPATADRYWAYSRAWLRLEVSGEDEPV
jgi:RNA polymerase sigma factor (TIGR02999 family)